MPQPGPQFQALPDPAPLPPLPLPSQPEESMAPSTAPETAPAGLPQPGVTSLQAKHKTAAYNGIVRHLLQDNPPELPAPLVPEPFAAEAPMTAPGVRCQRRFMLVLNCAVNGMVRCLCFHPACCQNDCCNI